MGYMDQPSARHVINLFEQWLDRAANVETRDDEQLKRWTEAAIQAIDQAPVYVAPHLVKERLVGALYEELLMLQANTEQDPSVLEDAWSHLRTERMPEIVEQAFLDGSGQEVPSMDSVSDRSDTIEPTHR
jgi:hypothetical protein